MLPWPSSSRSSRARKREVVELVQVMSASMEAKLLKVLLEKYPIDDHELSQRTALPLREVQRVLKGLEDRGWVNLERLPDKIFIRLRRFDFTFLGRVETQKKAVKHKGKGKDRKHKETVLRDEHDDIMYA